VIVPNQGQYQYQLLLSKRTEGIHLRHAIQLPMKELNGIPYGEGQCFSERVHGRFFENPADKRRRELYDFPT
jgi:hypothetical protein